MPLRHSSWKEHLLAKSNSVEGLTGNENFGSFPAATAKTTIQADALLKNLTEEGSVLLAATDDSKKLTLLHQLKNFDGTRTRPINKIVALSGTTVDSKILCRSCSVEVGVGSFGFLDFRRSLEKSVSSGNPKDSLGVQCTRR
ncbi:hypothetical protein ACHAWO_003081 [Cyclotella atomus]|uniref:Uncharacterized protein n=1 Tax=Cyclotella atomus TaxID=382360 RepID=A0ABD3PZ40_9STRA